MGIDGFLKTALGNAPSAAAVDDGQRTLTYRELDELAEIYARALASLGVLDGDRVAVLSRNCVEYVALIFAAARAGAVLVTLNWRLAAEELAWVFTDAAPKLVVAEPAFEKVMGSREWITFAALSNSPAREREPRGDEGAVPLQDAPCTQMYTSGTSGHPKGAVLTHGNWDAMVGAWLQDMRVHEGHRFLQVTPLFHVGGVLMVLSNVLRAATLYLLPEFEPAAAIEALARHRITHTLMVPAMVEWVLREPEVSLHDYPDLELLVYGAAPMNVATLRRAADVFGADFLQGYGLTESAGVLLTLTVEDHRAALAAGDDARLASAGRAVGCSSVRIAGPDGTEVPDGTAGEVVARGTNMFSAYWGSTPDRSGWREGWFRTGDVGLRDADGYITIVDREKDMILVGGENVYPREVERVLVDLPDVEDAAVIGIPHAIWGEAVHALVVAPSVGESAPNIRAWQRVCRSSLARFKCPASIEVVESLPRNAAGKLLKRELRMRYWPEGEKLI